MQEFLHSELLRWLSIAVLVICAVDLIVGWVRAEVARQVAQRVEELRDENEWQREQDESEREEQAELDTYFAVNGIPRHDDTVRVAAFAAEMGRTYEEQERMCIDCEIFASIDADKKKEARD